MNNIKLNQSLKGFTLVEAMMVVIILGLLMGVVVPKIVDQVRRSKEGDTKGSLAVLRSALLIYYSDNIGVDAQNLTTLTTKYIDAIPTAKIGYSHNDSTDTVNVSTFGAAGLDIGGWYYVSPSGTLYANCTHTDTKNSPITNW